MQEKLYVKNYGEKLIYEVKFKEYVIDQGVDIQGSYMLFNLELIAGIDYISEDSDCQGYVKADRFIEEVQSESIVVYVMRESLTESLLENGYTILDKLPTIY